MDAPLSSPSVPELDSRAIGGWAALEQGDLEEARAALQDVYSIDPAHPALPLLAAGIRRARPRQIPWRGIVLLLIALVAAGVFAWRSSSRIRAVPGLVASTDDDVAGNQREPEGPAAVSPNASPIGTAGAETPARPAARASAPASQSAHGAPDDEVQIRQAISRFATAYSSRWTPLAFSSCDVSRSGDTASATCRSHSTQGSAEDPSGATWVFACQKAGESWKIVRMQPPADLPPE